MRVVWQYHSLNGSKTWIMYHTVVWHSNMNENQTTICWVSVTWSISNISTQFMFTLFSISMFFFIVLIHLSKIWIIYKYIPKSTSHTPLAIVLWNHVIWSFQTHYSLMNSKTNFFCPSKTNKTTNTHHNIHFTKLMKTNFQFFSTNSLCATVYRKRYNPWWLVQMSFNVEWIPYKLYVNFLSCVFNFV